MPKILTGPDQPERVEAPTRSDQFLNLNREPLTTPSSRATERSFQRGHLSRFASLRRIINDPLATERAKARAKAKQQDIIQTISEELETNRPERLSNFARAIGVIGFPLHLAAKLPLELADKFLPHGDGSFDLGIDDIFTIDVTEQASFGQVAQSVFGDMGNEIPVFTLIDPLSMVDRLVDFSFGEQPRWLIPSLEDIFETAEIPFFTFEEGKFKQARLGLGDITINRFVGAVGDIFLDPVNKIGGGVNIIDINDLAKAKTAVKASTETGRFRGFPQSVRNLFVNAETTEQVAEAIATSNRVLRSSDDVLLPTAQDVVTATADDVAEAASAKAARTTTRIPRIISEREFLVRGLIEGIRKTDLLPTVRRFSVKDAADWIEDFGTNEALIVAARIRNAGTTAVIDAETLAKLGVSNGLSFSKGTFGSRARLLPGTTKVIAPFQLLAAGGKKVIRDNPIAVWFTQDRPWRQVYNASRKLVHELDAIEARLAAVVGDVPPHLDRPILKRGAPLTEQVVDKTFDSLEKLAESLDPLSRAALPDDAAISALRDTYRNEVAESLAEYRNVLKSEIGSSQRPAVVAERTKMRALKDRLWNDTVDLMSETSPWITKPDDIDAVFNAYSREIEDFIEQNTDFVTRNADGTYSNATVFVADGGVRPGLKGPVSQIEVGPLMDLLSEMATRLNAAGVNYQALGRQQVADLAMVKAALRGEGINSTPVGALTTAHVGDTALSYRGYLPRFNATIDEFEQVLLNPDTEFRHRFFRPGEEFLGEILQDEGVLARSSPTGIVSREQIRRIARKNGIDVSDPEKGLNLFRGKQSFTEVLGHYLDNATYQVARANWLTRVYNAGLGVRTLSPKNVWRMFQEKAAAGWNEFINDLSTHAPDLAIRISQPGMTMKVLKAELREEWEKYLNDVVTVWDKPPPESLIRTQLLAQEELTDTMFAMIRDTDELASPLSIFEMFDELRLPEDYRTLWNKEAFKVNRADDSAVSAWARKEATLREAATNDSILLDADSAILGSKVPLGRELTDDEVAWLTNVFMDSPALEGPAAHMLTERFVLDPTMPESLYHEVRAELGNQKKVLQAERDNLVRQKRRDGIARNQLKALDEAIADADNLALTNQEWEDVLFGSSTLNNSTTHWERPDQFHAFASNRLQILKDQSTGGDPDLNLAIQFWSNATDIASVAYDEGFDEFERRVLRNLANEQALRGTMMEIAPGRVSNDVMQQALREVANSPQAIRGLQRSINRALFQVTDASQFIQDGLVREELARVLAYNARYDLNTALKWAERYTNWFKRFATLTPGFNVRNLYGGAMQEVAAGHGISDFQDFVRAWRSWVDEGFEAVPDELRPLFRRIIEEGDLLDESTFRRYEQTVASRVQNVLSQRTGQLGGRVIRPLDTKLFGQRDIIRAIREGGSGQVDVETLLRGTHLMARMKRGFSYESARRSMFRYHFDYADINKIDRVMKIFMPFWMFMSRNMGLQLELVARRPQLYNNMLIWQERTKREYGDPLRPQFYDNFLNFTLPGGNAVLKPDLPINDLLETMNDFEEAGIAGPVMSSITNANPLVKIPLATMISDKDPFTGAPLPNPSDPLELLGLPEAFGQDGQVLLPPSARGEGPLPDIRFEALKLLSKVLPGGVLRNDDGVVFIDDRIAYALTQAIPTYAQVQRLFPNNPKMQQRAAASWLAWLTGGFREITDSERITEAYRIADEESLMIEALRDIGAFPHR